MTRALRGGSGVRLGWHAGLVESALPHDRVHPIDAIVEPMLTSQTDGDWAISAALGRLLARCAAESRPTSVLELGAGTSSRVIAAVLTNLGTGRLTALEQNPGWCHAAWEGIRQSGVDAMLVPVTPRLRLSRLGLIYRFAVDDVLTRRGPFDFVFVDAPQYWYGRDGALPLVRNHLAPGALIVLDDAGRAGERLALKRWLSTYPGLQLAGYDPEFGGTGVAILRWTGDTRAGLTLVGWTSSVAQRVRRFLIGRDGRRWSRNGDSAAQS